MGFFSRGSTKEDASASGGDGSGFLHPESSLESNRALQTSEWEKERSSQQLELEDVHAKDNGGCCRNAAEWSVKGLHVVDLCLGIAALVYGSLILTQFEQPAMAAVMFCMIVGCTHIITSGAGLISLFWKGCFRMGLMLSAFSGPYVAFVYLTIILTLAADENGFLKYLDDHKEVMYLGPDVAEKCANLMPLFYTILAVLGALEASRFCIMVRLRDRLRDHDVADPLIPRSGLREKPTSGGWGDAASSATVTSSTNKSLTEALLEEGGDAGAGEGDGGGAVGKESTGTPNWWESS